jgi:pyruvyl transferase EpsI
MGSKIVELLRLIKRNYILGFKEPFKGIIEGHKMTNEYSQYKNQKKVILMQTPTHRNLGDHAIAYAQKQFLIDNTTDSEIVEIPFKDVYKASRKIKKVLNKDDIIIIHGGGNMGDLYIYEEYMRRYIITYFRKYKVISFPQSIYFSDTFSGDIELFRSKIKYRKNKNLLLVAREKESYEKMKELFGEQNVILTPDIVLSLDKRAESIRKGILTCLRNDKEKLITESDVKKLYDNLKEKYSGIIVTDTLLAKDVAINQRETELNKMWKAIRGAEVVITDRLHGMIFCAITATPCIVFRNSNNKIEQSYNNWLSNLSYIKFCDVQDLENIEAIIEELRFNKDITTQFNECKNKFELLKNELKVQ